MRSSWIAQALTIAAAASITACVNCSNGTCNRYAPTPDERGVQIIGDSYFDYMGYIPEELAEKSGKVYEDRSRSGATLAQITGYYETARAEDEADSTYEIRTLLLDGGGNDMRKVCKTADQGPGFDGTFAGLSEACKAASSSAIAGAKALIDRTRDDEIDDVVWLGPHYFAADFVPQVIVDTFADAVQQHCQTKRDGDERNNCHFVETRGAWTPAGADAHLLGDRAHVNEEGGQIIADLLWQVMVADDVYR